MSGKFSVRPMGVEFHQSHDDNRVPALMTVNKEAAASWQPDRRVRYNFDTTEGRKNGILVPKRHQMEYLDFLILWLGTRGLEVQILSPRPILFQIFERHSRFRS